MQYNDPKANKGQDMEDGHPPCPYAGDGTSHTAGLLRHSHYTGTFPVLQGEICDGLCVLYRAVQGSLYLHSSFIRPNRASSARGGTPPPLLGNTVGGLHISDRIYCTCFNIGNASRENTVLLSFLPVFPPGFPGRRSRPGGRSSREGGICFCGRTGNPGHLPGLGKGCFLRRRPAYAGAPCV